jgi:adenylate kinase family enzyme
MNKIIVIGCPGSGKSTISKRIGQKLNIPVYGLDEYQTLSKEDFIKTQTSLMGGKKWILDGNFVKSIGNRIDKAGVVIFLDFPKRVVCYRFLKRSIEDFKKERIELGKNYWNEKWGVFKYIWNFPRAEIYQIIEKHTKKQRVVILHNSREADEFLSENDIVSHLK